MAMSRRTALAALASVASLSTLAGAAGSRPRARRPDPDDRFDPWVEVDAGALAHNVGQVSRLTAGRPILAVVKNNAYGLDLRVAAWTLEPLDAVAGFAVVEAAEAIGLREAGVRKPVLLMGLASDSEGHELVARDVALSLYTDEAPRRLEALAHRAGRPVDAHLYLDTGMGRMGMPYHRALPWLRDVAGRDDLRVRGTFMAFTEDREFDPEQLRRFVDVCDSARAEGAELGPLHAASSNGVFHLPDAHLDLVRPGIALYGAYPSRPDEERAMATLRPAVRLRCRVVRVERLRAGDGVGYGRPWTAERPTWVATLPVGHADGYPRRAVEGARVRIGDALYPVIGGVSASHCMVEVGAERRVELGDVATLLGPDDPAIEPNRLADAIGVSVYDLLMHLDPSLPRLLV